jgi:hypothetical protein
MPFYLKNAETRVTYDKIKVEMGPEGGLHAAPVSCSMPTRIMFISRRLDCISRSVCLLAMPHSTTSSVSGEEIG